MEFKDLLNFIRIEEERLQKRFVYDDKEKRILARTVKIAEEVGELCGEVLTFNSFQRKEKLNGHEQENLSEEFADVLFTTLLLARSMNIDIEKAMEAKMNKINKRYIVHTTDLV